MGTDRKKWKLELFWMDGYIIVAPACSLALASLRQISLSLAAETVNQIDAK